MFAAWTSAHKRSLLLLLLLPVFGGIAVGFSLPVTLFPDIVFPRVRLTLDAGDRPAEQIASRRCPVDNKPGNGRDFRVVRMGHRHGSRHAADQCSGPTVASQAAARHNLVGQADGSHRFSHY